MSTYRITRFYQDAERDSEVMKTGLSLEDAQAWCTHPETSSDTATSTPAKRHTEQYGPWFDGYAEER